MERACSKLRFDRAVTSENGEPSVHRPKQSFAHARYEAELRNEKFIEYSRCSDAPTSIHESLENLPTKSPICTYSQSYSMPFPLVAAVRRFPIPPGWFVHVFV